LDKRANARHALRELSGFLMQIPHKKQTYFIPGPYPDVANSYL